MGYKEVIKKELPDVDWDLIDMLDRPNKRDIEPWQDGDAVIEHWHGSNIINESRKRSKTKRPRR